MPLPMTGPTKKMIRIGMLKKVKLTEAKVSVIKKPNDSGEFV